MRALPPPTGLNRLRLQRGPSLLPQVSIGLGFSAGPPIGSLLAASGGFTLPFICGAVAVVCIMPISLLVYRGFGPKIKTRLRFDRAGRVTKRGSVLAEPLLDGATIDHVGGRAQQQAPSTPKGTGNTSSAAGGGALPADHPDVPDNNNPSPLTALYRACTVDVLIPGGFLFVGTAIFGLVEPIYALHAASFLDYGLIGTGYLLMVLSAVYSTCGVPLGFLADKFNAHLGFIFCGCCVSGLSLLFIWGRRSWIAEEELAPAHDTKKLFAFKLDSELVQLVVLGVGQAALLVPTLAAMQKGMNLARGGSSGHAGGAAQRTSGSALSPRGAAEDSLALEEGLARSGTVTTSAATSATTSASEETGTGGTAPVPREKNSDPSAKKLDLACAHGNTPSTSISVSQDSLLGEGAEGGGADDSVLALFNIFIQGGQVVGPLIGSWLNKSYGGYDTVCLFGAVWMLGYAAICAPRVMQVMFGGSSGGRGVKAA